MMEKSGNKKIVTPYINLGTALKYNSRGILFEGNSKAGYKHIFLGHIAPTIAKKGDTLYPRHLKESQIKNIIMRSLKKGKLVGEAKNGYKSYKYKLNKHGIKNMKVIVDKDNIIVTAYPLDGKSVIKYKPKKKK